MLVDAIQTIKKSTEIKFVVIKGAGNTFCAGDDITEMVKWIEDEHGNPNQGANGVLRRVRIYQDMANSLEELDKITIAAVDGFAVGGGLEITMACDFVIATERAVWRMPEVDALLEVLRSKNQQECRQLKYIVNRGCETDLYTAQGFEMLSAGLSGAVNGAWEVADADQFAGISNFTDKGDLWQKRRGLAKIFWSE